MPLSKTWSRIPDEINTDSDISCAASRAIIDHTCSDSPDTSNRHFNCNLTSFTCCTDDVTWSYVLI